jgi:hypothetical protein
MESTAAVGAQLDGGKLAATFSPERAAAFLKQRRSPDGTCDPAATSNRLGVARIASPCAEDGATRAWA